VYGGFRTAFMRVSSSLTAQGLMYSTVSAVYSAPAGIFCSTESAPAWPNRPNVSFLVLFLTLYLPLADGVQFPLHPFLTTINSSPTSHFLLPYPVPFLCCCCLFPAMECWVQGATSPCSQRRSRLWRCWSSSHRCGLGSWTKEVSCDQSDV
jgi:hypothetical protein